MSEKAKRRTARFAPLWPSSCYGS